MFFQIVSNLKRIFQYIYWKNLHVSGSCTVQTHVVQESTVQFRNAMCQLVLFLNVGQTILMHHYCGTN